MATNFVKAKFQEIYDMGTVSGKTTILGIHTPQGDRVQKLLGGFFRQFRKFRYSGCTISMVPAAQLPADPLQVSFEAGGLTVDPRDLLNPILFHGCHGESLNQILNQYLSTLQTNGSVGETRPTLQEAEAGYYSALSDPSFRKFGIQSGAKVSLKPLVHPLVMTNPVVPNDSNLRYYSTVDGQKVYGSVAGSRVGQVEDLDPNKAGFAGGFDSLGYTVPFINNSGISAMYGVAPTMFSNGLKPLGWLPTTSAPPMLKEGMVSYSPDESIAGSVEPVVSSAPIGATKLPKLFMGFFMLPPSYTQEMYFRLIINHYFEFKDFTTCLAINPDGPQSAYTETIPEPAGQAESAAAAEATSLEILDGNVALTTDGVY
uniref:Capsid protein n=1 Tax=Porcine associated porprismacovirus TaxID=2496634 RepID=A0A482JPS9_9VIRU|nr:capsid protein [Porcine associated porprismacovirus]